MPIYRIRLAGDDWFDSLFIEAENKLQALDRFVQLPLFPGSLGRCVVTVELASQIVGCFFDGPVFFEAYFVKGEDDV